MPTASSPSSKAPLTNLLPVEVCPASILRGCRRPRRPAQHAASWNSSPPSTFVPFDDALHTGLTSRWRFRVSVVTHKSDDAVSLMQRPGSGHRHSRHGGVMQAHRTAEP